MSTSALLTVPQVADIIGLSPKTVWGWVLTGQIGSTRIRGARRIERQTVEELIRQGRNITGELPKIRGRKGKPGPGRPAGCKNKPKVKTPPADSAVGRIGAQAAPAPRSALSGWPSIEAQRQAVVLAKAQSRK